jgi:PAS domain S-box-containing protein
MKIRNKINLAFINGALLITLVVGVTINAFASNELSKLNENFLLRLNNSQAEQVSMFLKSEKEVAEILAASTVFRNFLNAPINSPDYANQANISRERLVRSMGSVKQIEDLYIIDKNGKTVLSTDKSYEGKDRNQDAGFINGKEQTFIEEISELEENNLLYDVHSPIFDDKTHTFLGQIALRMKPENLFKAVGAEISGTTTGENFLVNENYTFLGGSRFLSKDDILTRKIETQNVKECFDPEEIKLTEQDENYNAPLKNYIDYRNKNIIGTHHYIPEAGWCLITKQDASEVFAPSLRMTLIIVLISLLSSAILIPFISYITGRITKSIASLQAEVNLAGSGSSENVITVKSNDEVGQLAEAFRKMLQVLKKSREDVDKKVEEQTGELKKQSVELQEQQKAILNILDDVEKEKIQAEKLAAIVKYSTEAILAKTLDGIITEWNSGAENLYGWTAKEIIGKNIKTIVPQEKYAEVDEIIGKVGKGDMVEHFQTVRIKKDGEKVDISLSASPIKDSSGKIIGISVIALDITKEKQIDKAKTEFVSLASHQLRTPLSTINWYSEMLLGGDAGKLNKEQKEFLQQIYTGNQRMVDLVNALLNVSRLELGTFVIDPEVCDLKDIAKKVIADILPQMKTKKQTFKEEYAKDLPKASVDKKFVDIIMQNLLSNAMKYTPEGGEIKFSISKDKDNFIISVADTGMGIPKNQQEKIFTKMFRADNVRESDTVGTGLGLYMVKSILEQSGGKIWFESTENKGTTFFIAIPLSGMRKKEGTKKLS